MPPKTWNVTELLYAFVGVLTQRKQPMIFSATHNVAPIAELVAEFIRQNNLPTPRPDYPKVQWPKGTDHLTNDPATSRKAVAEELEPEQAVQKIAGIIYMQDKKRQDLILASVLEQVKKWRQDRLDMARNHELGAQMEALNAQVDMDRLNSVIRGDFAILYPVKTPVNG